MALKNCEKCGRAFASVDEMTLCSRCIKENEDNNFKKVRNYLYDNPGADIKELARETGVDEKVILQFIRDGRIGSIKGANVSHDARECKKCGKSIVVGTICDDCRKKELEEQLMGAAKELRPGQDKKPEVDVKMTGKFYTRNDKN